MPDGPTKVQQQGSAVIGLCRNTGSVSNVHVLVMLSSKGPLPPGSLPPPASAMCFKAFASFSSSSLPLSFLFFSLSLFKAFITRHLGGSIDVQQQSHLTYAFTFGDCTFLNVDGHAQVIDVNTLYMYLQGRLCHVSCFWLTNKHKCTSHCSYI